jgi:hypothetical protein
MDDIQPNGLCLCAEILHRIFSLTMSTAVLFLFKNNNNKYYIEEYQRFRLMDEVIHGGHAGLSETRMLCVPNFPSFQWYNVTQRNQM